MHINLGRQLPSSDRGSGRAGTWGGGVRGWGGGGAELRSDIPPSAMEAVVTRWKIRPLHKSVGKQRLTKVSRLWKNQVPE